MVHDEIENDRGLLDTRYKILYFLQYSSLHYLQFEWLSLHDRMEHFFLVTVKSCEFTTRGLSLQTLLLVESVRCLIFILTGFIVGGKSIVFSAIFVLALALALAYSNLLLLCINSQLCLIQFKFFYILLVDILRSIHCE